jgi:hypothetical protein
MNTNARKSTNTTVATTSTTPAPSTPSPIPTTPIALPVPPKLLFAQQICALKECMTKEEWGMYLDACNMGKDFCSAGY